MLSISWKGGIGYGDMISPISYAHNAARKFNTDVELTYFWPSDPYKRYHPDDPETQIQRFDALSKLIQTEDYKVIFKHTVDNNINWRWINNFEWNNPFHSVCPSTVKPKMHNKVVWWRSKFNAEPVHNVKDSLQDQQWENIAKYLSNYGHEVVELTYRMTIDEVLHHINTCSFGFGYDGMVHQLFKVIMKPLVVIAGRVDLNHDLIPHACVIQDYGQFDINKIYDYVGESARALSSTRSRYFNFISTTYDYTKHKLYNVPTSHPGDK